MIYQRTDNSDNIWGKSWTTWTVACYWMKKKNSHGATETSNKTGIWKHWNSWRAHDKAYGIIMYLFDVTHLLSSCKENEVEIGFQKYVTLIPSWFNLYALSVDILVLHTTHWNQSLTLLSQLHTRCSHRWNCGACNTMIMPCDWYKSDKKILMSFYK